jgi:hypothetical protein
MTTQPSRPSMKLQPSHVVRESEQPYALGTGVSVTYAPDFAPGKAAWLVRFATDTDARMTKLLEQGWTHVLKRGALRAYDSAESKAQVQELLGEHAPKAGKPAKSSSAKSQASKPASTPKAAPVEEPKVKLSHVGTPAQLEALAAKNAAIIREQAATQARMAGTMPVPVTVAPGSMADATEMRMMLKHARKCLADLTMLVEVLESRLEG